MKLHVICIFATFAICSASPFKLNNATLNLNVLSRQGWVHDLGVRGCKYANQVRAQYGRSQLYYSASLTNIGASHSGWMAYYDLFQHQNLNGVGAWVGRQWLPVTAENIAMSVPRTNDAAWDAHQQWFHSRGHFLNMINPDHTHCGVGIAYDRYGRWWGTQLFGQNRYIGHEYGSGASVLAAPRPATARAPAAPAPAAGSTPRPRPPSGKIGSGDRPKGFQTSLLGEPLSLTTDISKPKTQMPKRTKRK